MVTIEVDLDLQIEEEINTLKARLKSLEDDLDIGKIIDGQFGDITLDEDNIDMEDVSIQPDVETTGEDNSSIFRSMDNKLGKIARRVATTATSASSRDIDFSKSGGSSLSEMVEEFTDLSKGEHLDMQSRMGISNLSNPQFGIPESALQGFRDNKSKRFQERMPDMSGFAGMKTSNRNRKLRDKMPSFDFDALKLAQKSRKITRAMETFGEASETVGKVSKGLNKALGLLVPRMSTIYKVVAALLPIIALLGAQLLAVGVAVGSVAAAGGIIGVLGALGGEADSLAGSMENAKQGMNDFKQEIFQIIEPVADQFAPILGRLADRVKSNIRGLTDELSSLGVFEPALISIIDGVGTAFEEFFGGLAKMAPQLNALVAGFSDFIGQNLGSFLLGIVKEGIKVADALGNMSAVIYSVLRVVYNLLTVLGGFISALKFLTPVLNTVANILGNKVVQTFLVLIVTALAFVKLVTFVVGGMLSIMTAAGMVELALLGSSGALAFFQSLLGGTWVMSAVKGIYSIYAAIEVLNTGLAKAVAAIGLLTGGLALLGGIGALALGASDAIGGLLSPETPSSMTSNPNRGGAQNVEMNFYGKQDASSRQRMVDVTKGVMHGKEVRNGNFGNQTGQ